MGNLATAKKINVLTQQVSWKKQCDTLANYNFIYVDFKCSPLALKERCEKNKVDLILCADYEIQSRFSKYYRDQVLALDIPWLLPRYEDSEIENKFKFYSWMTQNGLSKYLPPSKLLSDYPYVLKNGNGCGGKYVHIIRDAADLDAIDLSFSSQQYLCQQYIHGDEYAHHFIAVDGVCQIQRTFKHMYDQQIKPDVLYIRSKDLYNKYTLNIQLAEHYQHILTSIIRKLSFTGWGCIDLKIIDDKTYVFEINSRIGGSLIYYYDQVKDYDDFVSAYITSIHSRH